MHRRRFTGLGAATCAIGASLAIAACGGSSSSGAKTSGSGTATTKAAAHTSDAVLTVESSQQNAITKNALGDATQQDAVDSYNNGIFAKLIGGLGQDFLGGTATGKSLTTALAKI